MLSPSRTQTPPRPDPWSQASAAPTPTAKPSPQPSVTRPGEGAESRGLPAGPSPLPPLHGDTSSSQAVPASTPDFMIFTLPGVLVKGAGSLQRPHGTGCVWKGMCSGDQGEARTRSQVQKSTPQDRPGAGARPAGAAPHFLPFSSQPVRVRVTL